MAAGFKTATVNASDVPATQTDFPAYVDLSRTGITTLAEAQSVRVYADSSKSTQWAREIVSATEMWVKVPSLTSTVAIYVDWDGVSADYAATDTYGRDNVWTSDYKGVWHFESASGDSTVNANTGTDTSITYTTGKIGNGASLNGTSSRITTTDSITLTSTASLTISAWVYVDTLSSVYRRAAGFLPSNAAVMGLTNGNKFRWFVLTTGGAVDIGSSLSPSTATWYYLTGTYNGTNTILYINGSVDTSTARTTNFVTASSAMQIGADATTPGEFWPGDLDEMRVSQNVKSANWILTEYNNQSDEAGFWGTWTTVTGGSNTTNFFFLT